MQSIDGEIAQVTLTHCLSMLPQMTWMMMMMMMIHLHTWSRALRLLLHTLSFHSPWMGWSTHACWYFGFLKWQICWVMSLACMPWSQNAFLTVNHSLPSFFRAVHLPPVFSNHPPLSKHQQHKWTLDLFSQFYVNKYIDHHAFGVIFNQLNVSSTFLLGSLSMLTFSLDTWPFFTMSCKMAAVMGWSVPRPLLWAWEHCSPVCSVYYTFA